MDPIFGKAHTPPFAQKTNNDRRNFLDDQCPNFGPLFPSLLSTLDFHGYSRCVDELFADLHPVDQAQLYALMLLPEFRDNPDEFIRVVALSNATRPLTGEEVSVLERGLSPATWAQVRRPWVVDALNTVKERGLLVRTFNSSPSFYRYQHADAVMPWLPASALWRRYYEKLEAEVAKARVMSGVGAQQLQLRFALAMYAMVLDEVTSAQRHAMRLADSAIIDAPDMETGRWEFAFAFAEDFSADSFAKAIERWCTRPLTQAADNPSSRERSLASTEDCWLSTASFDTDNLEDHADEFAGHWPWQVLAALKEQAPKRAQALAAYATVIADAVEASFIDDAVAIVENILSVDAGQLSLSTAQREGLARMLSKHRMRLSLADVSRCTQLALVWATAHTHSDVAVKLADGIKQEMEALSQRFERGEGQYAFEQRSATPEQVQGPTDDAYGAAIGAYIQHPCAHDTPINIRPTLPPRTQSDELSWHQATNALNALPGQDTTSPVAGALAFSLWQAAQYEQQVSAAQAAAEQTAAADTQQGDDAAREGAHVSEAPNPTAGRGKSAQAKPGAYPDDDALSFDDVYTDDWDNLSDYAAWKRMEERDNQDLPLHKEDRAGAQDTAASCTCHEHSNPAITQAFQSAQPTSGPRNLDLVFSCLEQLLGDPDYQLLPAALRAKWRPDLRPIPHCNDHLYLESATSHGTAPSLASPLTNAWFQIITGCADDTMRLSQVLGVLRATQTLGIMGGDGFLAPCEDYEEPCAATGLTPWLSYLSALSEDESVNPLPFIAESRDWTNVDEIDQDSAFLQDLTLEQLWLLLYKDVAIEQDDCTVFPVTEDPKHPVYEAVPPLAPRASGVHAGLLDRLRGNAPHVPLHSTAACHRARHKHLHAQRHLGMKVEHNPRLQATRILYHLGVLALPAPLIAPEEVTPYGHMHSRLQQLRGTGAVTEVQLRSLTQQARQLASNLQQFVWASLRSFPNQDLEHDPDAVLRILAHGCALYETNSQQRACVHRVLVGLLNLLHVRIEDFTALEAALSGQATPTGPFADVLGEDLEDPFDYRVVSDPAEPVDFDNPGQASWEDPRNADTGPTARVAGFGDWVEERSLSKTPRNPYTSPTATHEATPHTDPRPKNGTVGFGIKRPTTDGTRFFAHNRLTHLAGRPRPTDDPAAPDTQRPHFDDQN